MTAMLSSMPVTAPNPAGLLASGLALVLVGAFGLTRQLAHSRVS
jgi:hypothetical protein